MPKFDTRSIAALGVLLAAEIVLTRFVSFTTWNTRIGFGFVPVVLAALLFGPVHAALVAGMGDFVGAILFPVGPYFPGFTLTAVLTGLVFGFFLGRANRLLGTLAAVAVVQFVLGLFLNTFWIHLLYSSPFLPLLATRLVQAVVLSVVQVVTIQALYPLADRLKGSAVL